MKIFNEEEVDKACQRHSELAQFGGEIGSYEHDASDLRTIQKDSYKEGVEYAESKVEDLCIEFAEWMFTSPMILTDDNGGVGSNVITSELFQEFLTSRNGK